MARWSRRAEPAGLVLIVLAYLVLGVLYATLTPPWQVPDEPAHYNYVRYLVEERRFPILQMGDYDQAYMDEITKERFDPALSIDPIRYEFHQPPLYYLLAAPIYALFDGLLLPLRLLSILLGAILLVVTYLAGKAMFPNLAWPALGMTAFVAFIPQHVAMTAAVENDALGELCVGLVLLGLIRWLRADESTRPRRLIGIGLCIGLGLLTKTTAYITLPLAVIAVGLKFWQRSPAGKRHMDVRGVLAATGSLLLPALLLGLPWFVRNARVYGGLDILGLERHGQVVVGQLRTSEWIAQHGWARLPGAFITTTFHSFWAQFGWMAVPIDARIYTVLSLLSGIAALGFLFWLIDFCTAKYQAQAAAILLACSGLLTLATFLGYNLSFYQAQGRYLFPALIPLSIAWVLGLRQILRRENAALIGIALALVATITGIGWVARVCGDKWRVLIAGLGTAFFGGRWLLPEWTTKWLLASTYVPLIALCAVSPFWFILPYLTP
jgi:4-amino-4-deoxy-L-arabinose transferase-like glycosyltransferase